MATVTTTSNQNIMAGEYREQKNHHARGDEYMYKPDRHGDCKEKWPTSKQEQIMTFLMLTLYNSKVANTTQKQSNKKMDNYLN